MSSENKLPHRYIQKPLKVLILEDDPQDAELMVCELRRHGFNLEWKRVENREDYLANLEPDLDLILADHALPQFSSLEALNLLKEHQPHIPFILVSGVITEAWAFEILKEGAADYLLKDRLSWLGPTVFRALEINRIRREYAREKGLLKESEERYRTVVESSLDGIALVSKGIHLFVNHQMAKLFGYSGPEELIGQPITLVIHPEDRQRVGEINRRRQAGENVPLRYQVKGLHKDGRPLTIEISGISTHYQGRSATLAFLRDVTERKQMEDALRISEEKLSKAFRASPDWMTISTLEEGRLIEVNDAFVEFTGFNREEALGKTTIELGIWVDHHDRDRILEKIRTEGFVKNFEAQVRLKSGDIRTTLWSVETFNLESQRFLIALNRDITEERKSQEKLKKTLKDLRMALGGTIRALALASETRDPYTAGHQKRVSDLARALAQEMGLSKEGVNGLRLAATIHDLGKISIPAEILSKPTKLSPIEFQLIKTHPQTGYTILKDIDFPWPIARMVLEHHERINGSGYPGGLTGDQVLLESKILMVADTVEAMASHRPYRPGLGMDQALEEISRHKGILYDPQVVEACLRLFREKGFQLEYGGN